MAQLLLDFLDVCIRPAEQILVLCRASFSSVVGGAGPVRVREQVVRLVLLQGLETYLRVVVPTYLAGHARVAKLSRWVDGTLALRWQPSHDPVAILVRMSHKWVTLYKRRCFRFLWDPGLLGGL